MTDKLVAKEGTYYICKFCDYKCSKKYNFNKHILTNKHKILTNTDVKVEKVALNKYACNCGRKYKHRQSLFTHQKKCNYEVSNFDENDDIIYDNSCTTITNTTEDIVNYKSMFFKIMDENKEVRSLLITQQKQIENQQKQIGELIPKIGNNNNNNIKQKLNLNIFLNEKCKDALNMGEFVKNLEISLQQLDITKNKGLAEGLSNVFIENMNKLSVYERPMHCTDIKRETLYIKDNDSWEKDTDKTKIKKAINNASTKQFKTLHQWTVDNPDFKEDDLKKDYFVHTLSNVSKKPSTVDDKIIKKICSNTYVK